MKEKVYTTRIGGCISIVCLIWLLLFSTQRTLKLVSKDDPYISMTTSAREPGPNDLQALGFVFVVSNVDPSIGKIEVEHVHWDKAKAKVKTQI